MKLYLLRHGETDWNVAWRLQGSTNIPLNEKGLLQAKEAAEKMKDFPFDLILSSPLDRALTTAKVIAEPHGLEVQVEPRLREMCFGVLEGTTPDYKEENPMRDIFFSAPEKYIADPSGETFEDVDARCKSLLADLKKLEGKYNCVLLSCHGAMVKALQRAVDGSPLEDFWKVPPIPNCTTKMIEI